MKADESPIEWQVSRVSDRSELRRWRMVAKGPFLCFGIDDQGGWVQFSPQTNLLLPFEPETALYFLPLLDLEHAAFASQLADAAVTDNASQARVKELVQVVVALALRERSPVYIERALRWLEHVEVGQEVLEALRELTRSKRGTQAQRQAAFRILRRSR